MAQRIIMTNIKKHCVITTCIKCKNQFEHSKYQIGRDHCLTCSKERNRQRLIERNKISLKDQWKLKYGEAWEERYNTWLTKMSDVASGERNGHFGHHHTEAALERIACRTRGKTLEEIYGIERASDMKHRMSIALSGVNNPAYGKVYVNGGKSIKGYYKNLFFRSLLEYSFMKHLENIGISLHEDVDYECFQAKFLFENRERTYRPDFYVKSQKTVYEIKPSYVIKNPPKLQLAKWDAMRELLKPLNLTFVITSELDFPKIEFNVAKQDENVIWKEDTFKYFKETK